MKQITIFIENNSRSPNIRKKFTFDPNDSFENILSEAGTELGIQAKIFFNKDGAVVEEGSDIKQGETIFVSQGEQFFVGENITATSNTIIRNPEELYIAMVGSNSPGKTSLVERYTRGVFTDEVVSTFENVSTKKVVVKGKERQLNVLDVSSLYELQCSMASNWFKDADGFALVYSISDRSSFEAVEELHSLLASTVANKMPPVVLIGNKLDEEAKRGVTTEEGTMLAKQLGSSFIETSAKKNINVSHAFDKLVKKTYSHKYNEDSSEVSCKCIIV